MRGVKDFFNAEVFAVVGASRDEKKVGNAIFKNLLDSDKKVYGVNPKAQKIHGRKIYADLLEVPHEIDCVVIATPAKTIPLILRQAAKRKAKSAIIISAGFSEIGNSSLEERILSIAKENKIQLLGPNSYGMIITDQKLNTTYYDGIPPEGDIAFVSQSGAIGSVVLDKKQPLSSFVSIGNSSQLDFSDFIEYFSTDKKTKAIAIYMESLKENRGKKFIEACKKCKKPIVVLKAGKSKEGQRAAKSHTAALASDQKIYSGAFKQAGIYEVDTIEQLFIVSKILIKYPKLGPKAAIITNAGGLGVLTTDACAKNKIKVGKLHEQTIAEMNKFLPENWSKNNPIDLIGDALAEDYGKTIKILEKKSADFIIVLLSPQRMTEALETARFLAATEKPVFACFMGGESITEAKEFMDKHNIIYFNEIEEMCKCIGESITQF